MWPAILHLAYQVAPRRVLDVGPGIGKGGVLLREYLGDTTSGRGRLERVDAVEAWPGYDTPLLRAVYDNLYLADACDRSAAFFEPYDLVLMIDVIEHMEKPAALALLDRMTCPVIVCTPVDFFHNPEGLPPTEAHVSHWTVGDFGGRVDHDASQLGGVLVRLAKL